MAYYKEVLLSMIFLLPMAISAQQLPHYTMYMANNFILNAALAGIEDYTDVKLAVRSQWVGIEDAPKTLYLTAHSPINSRHIKQNRFGIGGKIFMDKTGPISLSSAEINAAYHIRVSRGYQLALGVGAGAIHHRLAINKLRLEDPSDNLYRLSDFGKTTPLVNAGIWFYSTNLYMGLSAQNLLEQGGVSASLTSAGMQLRLRRHYFATAAYRFQFGDLYLTPSTMLKVTGPLPPGVDINLKGQFSDVMWAGVSWRDQDSMGIMGGVFISPTLNVAYSYDMTNSGLRKHTSGSHEIILGININNDWGPKCPPRAW